MSDWWLAFSTGVSIQVANRTVTTDASVTFQAETVPPLKAGLVNYFMWDFGDVRAMNNEQSYDHLKTYKYTRAAR